MATLPYRVLHRPRCPFCRRLRAYLAERSLEVELVDYQPETHHDELERLNPKAQVPVMQLPSGLALYESLIIMEFFEEEHPGSSLVPDESEARARMRLAYDLADSLIGQHLPRFVRAPADAPEKVSHRGALVRHAALAESWLSNDGPFAEGERFTLTDLSLPPLLLRAAEAGLAWDVHSDRIRAWCRAALKRPSLAALYPDVPLP
jgi:glutathione S-transferase